MSLFQDIETGIATIAAGQSLSGTVGLGKKALVGLFVPSNWTAADLTFQASPDGGLTWGELYLTAFSTANVSAMQVHSPSAGQFVAFDPTQLRGVNCVKVRSGTSIAPVTQAAQAAVTLILRGVM